MRRPLIADGGSLTVLRRLAAYAWGEWRVEWPDSVPEKQRPEPSSDDREFGYVYDMPRMVGRMGRRFVRQDVSIEAADYGPDGVVLPYSGFSDVEQALDEAAGRTEGDAFFEREIGREGLNGLVPFEDFGVGDLVDAGVWGLVIPDQTVAEVREVSEPGVGVVDWRVRLSGDLVPDDVGLRRSNLEVERQVWRERRERLKQGEREAALREAAIGETRDAIDEESRQRESADRRLQAQIDSRPTSEKLNQEIRGLNGQIRGLNTNLDLLKQNEINAIQSQINDKQTGINALNDKWKTEADKRFKEDEKLWAKQKEIDRRQDAYSAELQRRAPLFYTGSTRGDDDSLEVKDDVVHVQVDESLNSISIQNVGSDRCRCLLSVNVYALNNFSFHKTITLYPNAWMAYPTSNSTEKIRDWMLVVVRD